MRQIHTRTPDTQTHTNDGVIEKESEWQLVQLKSIA